MLRRFAASLLKTPKGNALSNAAGRSSRQTRTPA